MLYMPATTTTSPVVLQESQQNPLQSSSRYYMLQSAPVVPAVPVLNTTYIYPRYGFVPKPVETSVTKEEIEKSQPTQVYAGKFSSRISSSPFSINLLVAQPVQHVIHYHVQGPPPTTDSGYQRHSSPQPQQRSSRRDQFEHDEFNYSQPSNQESIDEKIERIRRELRQSSAQHPGHISPTLENQLHSRPRSSSGPRDPWRTSNQNNYPWRDAHLPAYREATLTRSQTPTDQTHTWKETAHERSHRNTQHSKSYHSKKDFVYQPKSEAEARKWYTQSTGKDPDREVHQALRGGTTSYKYTGSCAPHYERHQSTTYEHHEAPTNTNGNTHALRHLDSSHHHNLYASNQSTLHVVPKQGSTSDPPYLKILNAPVTYIH